MTNHPNRKPLATGTDKWGTLYRVIRWDGSYNDQAYVGNGEWMFGKSDHRTAKAAIASMRAWIAAANAAPSARAAANV
jgi:hypothetical protein